MAWPWVFREIVILDPVAVAHIAVAVVFCLAIIWRRRSRWNYVVLAGLLLSMYLSTHAASLGDREAWLNEAADKRVVASELLSNVLYHVLFRLNADPRYVGPIVGFVVALLYFMLCDYLFAGEGSEGPRPVAIACLLYLGSGLQLLFFYDYVENTQTSLPFLLLALLMCARYIRGRDDRFGLSIVSASLLLTLAGLFHGQHAFLLPAIFAAIITKRLPARRGKLLAAEAAASLAAMACLAGAVCGVLWAAGFEFAAGNATGGGDATLFVPLSVLDSKFTAFAMFSLAHWRQVANILTTLFPAHWLCAAAAVWAVIRGRKVERPMLLSVLTVFALGYVAFISLWGFDLGFPLDYDLMISMGIPLQLCLTAWAVQWCAKSRVLTAAIVGINLLYAWTTISLLLL